MGGASKPFPGERNALLSFLSQAILSFPEQKYNHCSDFPKEWVIQRKKAAPTSAADKKTCGRSHHSTAGFINAVRFRWLSAPYLESFKHQNSPSVL